MFYIYNYIQKIYLVKFQNLVVVHQNSEVVVPNVEAHAQDATPPSRDDVALERDSTISSREDGAHSTNGSETPVGGAPPPRDEERAPEALTAIVGLLNSSSPVPCRVIPGDHLPSPTTLIGEAEVGDTHSKLGYCSFAMGDRDLNTSLSTIAAALYR